VAVSEDLWAKVFCSYTKDQALTEKWLESVKSMGALEALRRARSLVEVKGRAPDAITLGFSPQVLVGALSLLEPGRKLVVLTSPEVVSGQGPARLSKLALTVFAELVELEVAPFAPSQELSPEDVIARLTQKLSEVKRRARLLDISGGTQLVPIAALRAGFSRFTYAYPNGRRLVFYEFETVSPGGGQ